jgi:hypothetical protein
MEDVSILPTDIYIVYDVAISYSVWLFGIFLVYCTKKNLATQLPNGVMFLANSIKRLLRFRNRLKYLTVIS